jgi:hypothetical protein
VAGARGGVSGSALGEATCGARRGPTLCPPPAPPLPSRQVLCDPNPARATAAVESLSVLVTTTLRLHEARKAFQASQGDGGDAAAPAPAAAKPGAGGGAGGAPKDAAKKGAAASGSGEAETAASGAAGGGGGAGGYEEGPTAGTTATGGGAGRDPPRVAAALGLPQLFDDLLPRVLHCCWDDAWGARLGGVAAVRLLWRKLPAEYLTAWLPQLLRALMVVTRHLPEHSLPELSQISETLSGLVDKCYGPGSPGAAAVARFAELHPPAPGGGEEDASGAGKDAKDGGGGDKDKEKDKPSSAKDKAEKEDKDDAGDKKAEAPKDKEGDGMEVDKKEASKEEASGAKSEGGGGASEGGAGAGGDDKKAAPADKKGPPPEPTEPQLQRAASVLVEAVMSATTPERTRQSAQACLEQLGGLVGRAPSAWLRPVVSSLKVERWRLIPIKVRLGSPLGGPGGRCPLESTLVLRPHLPPTTQPGRC